MLDFLALIASLLAALLAGVFFKYIDLVNNQRRLYALLKVLINECKYNLKDRGNSQVPFQLHWLQKALKNLDFHEQCKDIVDICLDTLEHAKNANNNRDKPGGVQRQMETIKNQIVKALPQLKKQITLRGYLWWLIQQIP